MKQKLIITLVLPLLLTGCMNEFESIFDGNNADAIAPLTKQESGEAAPFLYDDYDSFSRLAGSVLSDAGAPRGDDYAMIINDKSLLKDLVVDEETTLSWPEIDFNKYSLIIGRFCTTSQGYRVENQRVVKKAGNVELYLEIVSSSFGHLESPAVYSFGALYPKLPDCPVVIKRWNNY